MGQKLLLFCCRLFTTKVGQSGSARKTLFAMDESTRLPSRGEVREDATHRLAFDYLHECFAASQSASSLRIREAICLSLKGRSSIGFDIEKSSSPSIQIPAVRKSSPSVCRARSCRRCVQARYTSRFVASKCSQRVDVQLYCLEDRHALRRLDALAN